MGDVPSASVAAAENKSKSLDKSCSVISYGFGNWPNIGVLSLESVIYNSTIAVDYETKIVFIQLLYQKITLIIIVYSGTVTTYMGHSIMMYNYTDLLFSLTDFIGVPLSVAVTVSEYTVSVS